MKCPHCLEGFHEDWEDESSFGRDDEYVYTARDCTCPSCERRIIQLGKRHPNLGTVDWTYIYPKAISRSPVPLQVDDEILVSDYKESCLVLADSPKASAALSRRCLQQILREKAGITKLNLDQEIQAVLDTNALPSDIAENLDAVRVIGNFAAHPMKSTNTGEVLDVEPQEAEWNLEVVEQLMDFYYVRPAVSKQKRDTMNAKLQAAGKPPLK